MKDPIKYIRQAMINALNGNISYNGSNVPVYGRVPSSASEPYIKIYSVQTNEADQNADEFITETLTRIEVVTAFDSDSGGELEVNTIVNDILVIIRTRSSGYFDLSSNDFHVYTCVNEGVTYLEDDRNDKTYFTSIIDISNRVLQV
jgi:hypothetical protein